MKQARGWSAGGMEENVPLRRPRSEDDGKREGDIDYGTRAGVCFFLISRLSTSRGG